MRRSVVPRPLLLTCLALLALGLGACTEATTERPPPLDAFYFPTGIALATRTGTTVPALLVASSNIDLRYGPDTGGSLISVDPALSLGAAGGALTVLGAEQIGSYAGPLTVVEPATCPGLASPLALVASRFGKILHVAPLGPDGGLAGCPAGGCDVPMSAALTDPFAVGVACRADGARRTAFVSYLTSRTLGTNLAGTGWLTSVDLDDLHGPVADFALGIGPVADMAYDEVFDRLYAVGRHAGLVAPLYVVSLPDCRISTAGCPLPDVTTIDLWALLRGADLQGIALSNLQAGLGRRAYVSARIYDPDLAAALGGRPGADVGSALLVLDMAEDPTGRPAARLIRVVELGLGAGQVRVLPVRPGQRDLVVTSSAQGGDLIVYDDDVGAVVSVTALNPQTGAPSAGREPFALAVQDDGSGVAHVWVAAFDDSTVSRLDVPLAAPGLTHMASLDGAPLRLGRKRP